MDILFLVAEFLILLFLAAFFSCEETAITAISEIDYRRIKKSSRRREKMISSLIEKKEKIVTSTLIATNFLNMLLSSIVTVFTVEVVGSSFLPLTTGITTIFIIIFAEILPKTLATHSPLTIIKATHFCLYISYIISLPFVLFFSVFSRILLFILHLFKKNKVETEGISEKKMNELIDISKEDGILASVEETLLKKAVVLKKIKAIDIATHLSKMVYVRENFSYDKIMATFEKSRFSRLPLLANDTYDVCNKNAMSITKKQSFLGLIHYKDVMFSLASSSFSSHNFNAKAILKTPIFISHTLDALSILTLMNEEKRNMAFVLDDEENVIGLLTMDDIFSLLCGKSSDN